MSDQLYRFVKASEQTEFPKVKVFVMNYPREDKVFIRREYDEAQESFFINFYNDSQLLTSYREGREELKRIEYLAPVPPAASQPPSVEKEAEEKAKEYREKELSVYNNRYQEAGQKDFAKGYIAGHTSCASEIQALQKEVEGLNEHIKEQNEWLYNKDKQIQQLQQEKLELMKEIVELSKKIQEL